jgi:hypothetical protein
MEFLQTSRNDDTEKPGRKGISIMLWLLLAESPDSRWVNGQMGEFQNRNADKTAVVGGAGGRALCNFRRFGIVTVWFSAYLQAKD